MLEQFVIMYSKIIALILWSRNIFNLLMKTEREFTNAIKIVNAWHTFLAFTENDSKHGMSNAFISAYYLHYNKFGVFLGAQKKIRKILFFCG